MSTSRKKTIKNDEVKALVFTPPQLVVKIVLQDLVGESLPTRKEFDRKLPEPQAGVPDTLMMLCAKEVFKNCDLTDYIEPIKVLVENQNLTDFSDFCLQFPQEILQLIATHAKDSSMKIKFHISKERFKIVTGIKTFATVPFTEDMEKPAAAFADYTRILFAYKKYNIEFAFFGEDGQGYLQLGPKHLLLFKEIVPDCFAERARGKLTQERLSRFTIFMKNISYRLSYFYFNAILEHFHSYRPTIYTYGEVPCFKIERTYQEMMALTRFDPKKQHYPPDGTSYRQILHSWSGVRQRRDYKWS